MHMNQNRGMQIIKDRQMSVSKGFRRYGTIAVITTACAAGPAVADNSGMLAAGHYRVEGACSQTFYLGAKARPQCDHYLGISADDPARPIFIFPLTDGGGAWFFVTTGQHAGSSGRTSYTVGKVYDKALNAEFAYPAGECEMTAGPGVRCTVWKDESRSTPARELIFTGTGNWMRTR
ncbi:hypothetical protein DKK66_18900 [Aquitalea sp. USM4]|nr:hypothetical protein DKK66_18900 [Aquitalea sp. USM4]